MAARKRSNKTNKDWTPALKAKAVKLVFDNPSTPMIHLAKRIGCSGQSLAVWVNEAGGRAPTALPTKHNYPVRKRITKTLVASAYKCPHCGESVEVPA